DDPAGKWMLKNILKVSQWEDPCPFWDDNGNAYLVRSKLCGGPAYLHWMTDDGLSLLDNGKIVCWNNEENPVLEGLKMIKRNGWYYILAPAGGVATGWQTVLRSKI
ncbi:MAG: family 43 glycosylhydrolase, partial [Clostridiales bacterium]|nr:family 43 glycosylhydrolase [Clostridiales bacterium]